MTFGGEPDGVPRPPRDAWRRRRRPMCKAAASSWLDAPHYTMVVKPYPAAGAGQTDARSQDPAAARRRARGRLPRRPARDAGERPEGDPARAALDAARQRRARRRRRLRRRLAAKAGLASLALDLMDDGTTTRDAFRIVDELDALGARLVDRQLARSVVRAAAGAAANLRRRSTSWPTWCCNPSFPADLVDAREAARLAQIGQEKAQPTRRGAARRCRAPLRRRPRLRQCRSPAPASSDRRVRSRATTWPRGTARGSSPDNSDADRHRRRHDGAARCPSSSRRSALEARRRRRRSSSRRCRARPGGKVYLIDKPGRAAVGDRRGARLGAGRQPEDLAIETVMRNFGGMATSRLNRNLRLDKHWSYGTPACSPDARGQRPFYRGRAGADRQDQGSDGRSDQGDRGIAGERPITGEEFASIMRNQTLGLPGRFETLAALEARGDRSWSTSATRTTTSPTTRATCARSTKRASPRPRRSSSGPTRSIWLVVGDLRKVEAGIRELGYGDVVRLDADGKTIDQGVTR